ncbi:cartilage intermediate layer protein 1-like isoform X2 [Ylistrum balloti]|uniref:cartilage intermediate layer protein 1-like isoform X2 n=1 Tax=Ylistrum balloti TaxID=509963 RepID=UPI002905B525|nr:cartilage intermediate layer protein 1-like isoform X2 [Ylistrum balloti]
MWYKIEHRDQSLAMDTLSYGKYRRLSAGKTSVDVQREPSEKLEIIAVEPVSSPHPLKICLIVAAIVMVIGLIAAIPVALVIIGQDPETANKNNPPPRGMDITPSTFTTEGTSTTPVSPTHDMHGTEETTARVTSETTSLTPDITPSTITTEGTSTTPVSPTHDMHGTEETTARVTSKTTSLTPDKTTSTTKVLASPSTTDITPSTFTTEGTSTTPVSPTHDMHGTEETTARVTSETTSLTPDKTTSTTKVLASPSTTDITPSTFTTEGTSTTPVSPTHDMHGTEETTARVTSGTTSLTPATPGTWNNWGSWTTCGATCGNGYHTRYRTCFRTSANDPVCQGEYVQTTTCSVTTCPVYGVWTTWSGWCECDVTCGGGTQLRTRVCQKSSSSDLNCVGTSTQSQTCSTWNCPDCSQTCPIGALNADCTACECTSNTVQGIVRNHVNVPLDEATIAHASVPYKTLATSNKTGGFVLVTTCDAVELIITRAGYADVTVAVTESSVTVQMSLIAYPAISMNPKPRVRVKGENVTFCCEAYGNPSISNYEWMKDGVLINDSKYPDGFNLTLNDVTTSDSGQYKCRANSPVGAVYSSAALLTVKSSGSVFCEEAYEEKKISLPSDCVQVDGTTLYEIGGCAKKTCRGDNNEEGLCGPSKKFCCLPSSEEERTVRCNDYSLQVIIITGCSCGECSSTDITIQGQVTGLNTGVKLRLGTIYVNGSSVARTTFSGLFSFTVPAGTLSVAMTFEDTIFKTLLTTTRLITFSDSMEGPVYRQITMMEAAPPITISTDVENTISMGNYSGMPAVSEVILPSNSFVDESGNPYNGVVKASMNMFDPRNLSSISSAPGTFEFIDAEGETQDLQTFGVIVMDFSDESGNKVNIAGNVTIKLDAALVESTYSGNVTDVKLWGLNSVTGQWEEIGPTVVETSKRRKRQTAKNYLVGKVQVSAFQAINLDCYRGFSRCYLRTAVKDRNNIPVNGYTVRVMHMTYPGEKYPGRNAEYVTAVKESSSNSDGLQYTFCRSDAWGYIQVFKRGKEYEPGISRLSGLTQSARSRLTYETTTDPIGVKTKFLLSGDGPFRKYGSLTSINVFNFYQRSTSNFADFTLLNIDPSEAYERSLNTDDIGPKLWYPHKKTLEMSDFTICMIKIEVTGTSENLSFSIRSKAGTNSGIEDTVLGIRQEYVENSGACIEYKCSGKFPLFKNLISSTGSQSQHDYTKVTITPVGRLCTVSWEGEIKSHDINTGSSNIGTVSPEWFIPDTEEHGIYIYEQTLMYGAVDWEKARETTRNMCKKGVKSPSDETNPSMNAAVDPALRFTCI